MTKKDYIDLISQELNLTKKDVTNVINSLFTHISESLEKDTKVMISNFGTFEVVKTKPYNVYSPVDGKLIDCESQIRVHFKSSQNLKKILNK